MTAKLFETGKTYYTFTKKGDIRLFTVKNILKRKSTGERVFVVASFDGKADHRYEIRTSNNGNEFVIADTRFNAVVTADEYKAK